MGESVPVPRETSEHWIEKAIRFPQYTVIGAVSEVSKCSWFLRNFFIVLLVQKKYLIVNLFGS